MSLYTIARNTYQAIIPSGLRHQLYAVSPRIVRRLRRKIIRLLESTAKHDEIYDQEYYRSIVEPTMELSAEVIAESIASDLSPESAVDLGCGTGLLLFHLQKHGIDVQGFDYSSAALAMCDARGMCVQKFDIENDHMPDLRVDLVLSTEVAEHLPESVSDRYIKILMSLSETVFLTAATPSDAGTDHVNEQPNEYWIEKFESQGYMFDRVLSFKWRNQWRGQGVAGCFANSAMIFRKQVSG